MKMQKKNGFSLLELAIVIVIIAVLIAASTKAMRLVRNAEYKNMMAEISSYESATNNFYTYYQGYPGDMATASTVFVGTNGDGGDTVDDVDERVYFWQHLYLAKLINFKGGITGTGLGDANTNNTNGNTAGYGAVKACSGVTRVEMPGFNIPDVAVSTGGIGAEVLTLSGTIRKVVFEIGAASTVATSCGPATYALFSPRAAFYIDNKYDDGLANYGVIQGVDGTGEAANSCNNSGTGLYATDVTDSADAVTCYITYSSQILNLSVND
jgi:prepilin-type N-terminal cleavage/methylation domain-containing protein